MESYTDPVRDVRPPREPAQSDGPRLVGPQRGSVPSPIRDHPDVRWRAATLDLRIAPSALAEGRAQSRDPADPRFALLQTRLVRECVARPRPGVETPPRHAW